MSTSSSDVILDHDSVQVCAAFKMQCSTLLHILYMLHSYHEIGFTLCACTHTGQIGYTVHAILGTTPLCALEWDIDGE